jgi:metal-responsive CopG/Arc/MetJ family transcriptional regulator
MSEQETLLARKRGPKPTGKGVTIGVRLQPKILEALDAWRVIQDGSPKRAEAVRRLIEKALAG